MAMQHLYRCAFCASKSASSAGGVFLSAGGEKALCPKAGCGRPSERIQKDVASAGASILHFVVRDDAGPAAGADGRRWRFACAPTVSDLTALRHTDQPEYATCSACLASADWKALQDDGGPR